MQTKLSIRDAGKEDAEAMSKLMTDLGYHTSSEEMLERFEHIAQHADYKTLLACIDDGVVGMAGAMQSYFYEQNGTYARLLVLVTSPSHRQLGIGKALLQAVEDWARKINASSVFLNCGNREERQQAHPFYKKHGYTVRSSGYFKKR
jgi:GNAT superfamily N-acetyltransferase